MGESLYCTALMAFNWSIFSILSYQKRFYSVCTFYTSIGLIKTNFQLLSIICHCFLHFFPNFYNLTKWQNFLPFGTPIVTRRYQFRIRQFEVQTCQNWIMKEMKKVKENYRKLMEREECEWSRIKMSDGKEVFVKMKCCQCALFLSASLH